MSQEKADANHCGKLWDSQWVNVVNHDNCYAGWDMGEAINHAVKLTENYLRENFDTYAATLKAAQGGVTEAMVGRVSLAIYARAMESGKRLEPTFCDDMATAALSAEPAAQPEQEGPGEEDGPWAEGWAQRSGQAEPAAQGDVDFKNFHRLLCERFGYVHDPVDWKRDQLSLIEHIAHTAPPAQPAEAYFPDANALADWLESLHECHTDGAVGNRKWEAAQIAAKAVRASEGGKGEDRG